MFSRDVYKRQALLQERGSIQSRQQRFATMLEQINIRKAELTKRLLDRKTREAGLDEILDDANKKLNAVNEETVSYTHLDVYKRQCISSPHDFLKPSMRR